MTSATSAGAGSTWAPLRSPVFRALWIAQFVSNLGTWMQTVGAQWMLVGDPRAAVLVPLVQTATTLPVMLLALPSGVVADLVDRQLPPTATPAASPVASDRKSTRLNSSHVENSYAVFCLKKKRSLDD